MEFSAICARTSPVYNNDSGTARCRLARSQFNLLKLSVGWAVSMSLTIGHRHGLIICTVWPDTKEFLGDNDICIDDTIFTDLGNLEASGRGAWLSGTVKVFPAFIRTCHQRYPLIVIPIYYLDLVIYVTKALSVYRSGVIIVWRAEAF